MKYYGVWSHVLRQFSRDVVCAALFASVFVGEIKVRGGVLGYIKGGREGKGARWREGKGEEKGRDNRRWVGREEMYGECE